MKRAQHTKTLNLALSKSTGTQSWKALGLLLFLFVFCFTYSNANNSSSTMEEFTDCSSISNSISGFIYMGEYNGSKYYCSQYNKTWSQATALVAANGGQIAVINNAGENSFLASHIMADVAWIGYTDEASEGNFHWYNGASSSYTNWMSGEPNDEDPNHTGADNAVLSKNDGSWYDRNGANAYEVIMEIECNSTPPTVIQTCQLLDHGVDNNTSSSRLLWMDFDGSGVKRYSVLGSSTLTEYSDGTALLTGTAEQIDNTCNKWEYSVKLLNKRSWAQWSSLGRSFKPGAAGTDHTAWDYYELDNNNSTFTGIDCFSGKSLTLTHNPGSYEFGFQVGLGANLMDTDFGLSGWFGFSGSYTGHGDFNGDVNCGTSNGTIESIILTNGTESITLVDGGVYQICDLPVDNYLEAIVSGTHESFYFNVDGDTRTENVVPYNYPAVSNGDTWNPGVGTHTILGTLYSENGATGTDLDDVSLNITIIECGPTTATIGNFVFNDLNGDGIQGANEPGIDGVTVMLLDANGNMVGDAQTTANGGAYDFLDVAPGTYKVKFTAPTSNGVTATLTDANQGNDDDKDSDAVAMPNSNDAMTQLITVAAGDDIDNLDAGYYFPAKIGNFVFEDKNGNGTQDVDEPGIDGVTVMLLDANGNMVGDAQTTANGGAYSFDNVVAGTYKVKFTAPTSNGVTATLTDANQGNDDDKDSDAVAMPNSNDAMTQLITVAAGDDIDNLDAGYYFPAKLGNYVFYDSNLDGIQGLGEAAIPGVPVELRDENGNTLATGSTDNDGLYTFDNLKPGVYKVVFPKLTVANNISYIVTNPNQGTNDAADSDAVPMPIVNEAMSQLVTLQSGDNDDSIDAGYFATATLGDFAFIDENANGLQDNQDRPLPNVLVELSGFDVFGNEVSLTQETDEDGKYLFENLTPGEYDLTFSQPVSYLPTLQDVFGNGFDEDDSDIDADGRITGIVLGEGEDNRTYDAGFFLDPSLPVALTSFEAQLINNSEVILKWATASEENNKHFVVERSMDGRDFEAIGVVEGKGTTNTFNTYKLVDNDPFYGTNYYRLRQVDFDGKYEFSNIETVLISGNDLPDMIMYPNPVVKTTTLRMVTPFEADTNIEIVDHSGKVLLNVVMEQGANSKQIDLGNFAPGMYFAYINYGGHRTMIHKIIKVEE